MSVQSEQQLTRVTERESPGGALVDNPAQEVKKMAFANDVTIALREACDHAKHAAATEDLNEVHESGARARQTLESIKRNELDEPARQDIEQAIRHARNAELAVHADGGRLDAEKSRDLISGLLEPA